MNEPDRPHNELRADELDRFERQLRTLTPRSASFQLSEPRMVANSAQTPPRTIRWAATLLVIWSLGAAAGVAGTLVSIRFVNPPSVIESFSSTLPKENGEALVRLADSSSVAREVNSVVADDGRNDQSLSPSFDSIVKSPDGTELNLFTSLWGNVSWPPSRITSNTTGVDAPLNAFADLDRMVDEQRFAPGNGSSTNTSNAAGGSVATEEDSSGTTTGRPVPRPMNQRDLLRSLLITYGTT